MDQEREREQNFAQMWVDAQTRFEERTKKPLKQAKNQSLNDAMAQLDQHFNLQDTNPDDKKARAKKWAMNLLKFIQLLGGIIAQGASVVVGPASLCFNALSFLLNIPTRISSFYDDLSALFQELSSVIKQFRIYQRMDLYADVGSELKEDTHKLMIAFVDVCAISIDFFGGSRLHTIGTLTKLSLFNNDSDLKSKLADFKTLISHQSQITGAITLEHVLKAEHETSNSFRSLFKELNISAERSQRQLENTEVLVKDTNERNAKDKQREEFENICKKLSVEADVIRQLGEEAEQIQSKNLRGTGSWLREMDAYKQWIDVGSRSGSQLLLSGNTGSGKSCLAFAVLEALVDDFTTAGDSSMKVSVAFYRFARKKQKSSDTPVRDSLKYMAAQIAKTNRVFSRKLSKVLKSKSFSLLKDTSPDEISKELFAPASRAEDWSTAFVLLFDGIDQLSEDDATQLFKVAQGLDAMNLSILLTGTEEKFLYCRNPSGKGLGPMPLIKVQEHNETDIRGFIEHYLTYRKILQGDAPGVLKIVDQLREKLPDKANGNFNDVRQIIDGVSKAIDSEASEDQIMQLISAEKSEDSNEASRSLLDEMNHSLNVQEIEQLNELLAWVIYGVNLMTTEELIAALFLRTKRALLQNLVVKIKRKYDRILRIESNSYVARKRLNRKALGWLRQADAKDILYPWSEIAAMIARKWLCDRSFDVFYPYRWISIFVLRQGEIQSETEAPDQMAHNDVRQKPTQEDKRFSTEEDLMREGDAAFTSIERCSEWAVEASTIVKDSLFYERLGSTFLRFGQTDAAKKAFLKAKELPNPCRCLCRNRGADWEIKLANNSKAIAKLEEAIHIDEHYYESYFKLFKLFKNTEHLPQALKILGDMHNAYDAEHKSLTKLSAMLLEYNRWLGGLEYLEQLLQMTKPHDFFDDMLSALQMALNFAQNNHRDSDAVHLYLGYGVALAHYSADETEKRLDSAVSQWRESYRIGLESEDHSIQYSAIVAAKCIFNYHFSQARVASSQSSDTTDYKFHVEQMVKLAEAEFTSQYEERPLRFSLASYYTLSQNREKAQKLLLNDLRAGLSLLSDDDFENDLMGYHNIAKAHMYTGDDCNALSAWSLYGPSERHIKDEPDHAERPLHVNAEDKQTDADVASRFSPWPESPPFSCDGGCNKQFTYANSLWFCKVCDDVQFCDECLRKVQTGTLPRYVCAADHQWLLVPSWVDEYMATGKGRVRVGGVIEDGKRIGGEIVSIAEWLDTIRERWGIKRSNEEEQDQH